MLPDAKQLVAWVVAPPNGLGEASPFCDLEHGLQTGIYVWYNSIIQFCSERLRSAESAKKLPSDAKQLVAWVVGPI